MSGTDPTQAPGGSPSLTDRRVAKSDVGDLRFDRNGLLPVVAQDADTGAVLMVAWANRDAVEATLERGEVHFWSRSRSELWRKGETSGNVLTLVSLHADCDGDTLLARVRPAGPACHTGETTCFGADAAPAEAPVVGSAGARAATDTAEASPPAPPTPADDRADVLDRLDAVLRQRAEERPDGSYTVRLLDDDNLRLKKLGEETAELITALARGEDGSSVEEAADLVYHVLVALRAEGYGLDELRAALDRRAQ